MPSQTPKVKRFTTQELHCLIGFRNLKNYENLISVSQPTITIAKGGELPLEIRDVTTIPKSNRNTKLVLRPPKYLRVVHMDIGYGPCISISGFKYVLLFVDRVSRKAFVYGIKNLTNDSITDAFIAFKNDAGGLPFHIFTDFDTKLIGKQVKTWLQREKHCNIRGNSAGRQDKIAW